MEDDSISARTQELRREIELVTGEQRIYRAKKLHSEAAKSARVKRQLRLVQIRAELERLRKEGKRLLGNGQDWLFLGDGM